MARIRAKGLVVDHRLGEAAQGVIPVATKETIAAAQSPVLAGLTAFVDPRVIVALPDGWRTPTAALALSLAALWQHGVREAPAVVLASLTGAEVSDLPRLLRLVGRDGPGHVQAEAVRGRVLLKKADARLMRPGLWRPFAVATAAYLPEPLLRAWAAYETAAALRSAEYRAEPPPGTTAAGIHAAAGAAIQHLMPDHILGTYVDDDGNEVLEARPREERSGYVSAQVQATLSVRDRRDLSLRWMHGARALEAAQAAGLHLSPEELRRLWLAAANALSQPDDLTETWPFPFPAAPIAEALKKDSGEAVRVLLAEVVRVSGANIFRHLPCPWTISDLDAEALDEAADARASGDTGVFPWRVHLRRQSVSGWLARQRRRLVRVPASAIVRAAFAEVLVPESARSGLELLATKAVALKGAVVREAGRAASDHDVLALLAIALVEDTAAEPSVRTAAAAVGGFDVLADILGRGWRAAVEARRPFLPVLNPEEAEKPDEPAPPPSPGALARLVRPAARPLVLAGDYGALLELFEGTQTTTAEILALSEARNRPKPYQAPLAPAPVRHVETADGMQIRRRVEIGLGEALLLDDDGRVFVRVNGGAFFVDFDLAPEAEAAALRAGLRRTSYEGYEGRSDCYEGAADAWEAIVRDAV